MLMTVSHCRQEMFYSGQNVCNTDMLLHAGLLRFHEVFWFLLHLCCVQQSLSCKFSKLSVANSVILMIYCCRFYNVYVNKSLIFFYFCNNTGIGSWDYIIVSPVSDCVRTMT